MSDPLGDIRVRLGQAYGRLRVLNVAAGVLVAFYLLLPIAVILPTAFTKGDFIQLPRDGLSLRWFREILTDPAWTSSLLLSFRIALVAALIATTLGTAAALGVRRLTLGRGALTVLMISPLVLPYVVYALGLFDLVSRLAVAIESTWPIAVGQAVLAFPIVFVAVSAGLAAVDPTLPRAAESLGARWHTVVWHVELPAIRTSIGAAGVFSFAFCFDQVEVALFLAAPTSTTLPVQIFSSAREDISPAIGAASTLVMAVAFLLAALFVLLFVRTRRQPTTHS